MKSTHRQLNGTMPQVMLLTRHYWPFSSDATWRLRSMSQLLRRDNWQVQVVTPRWHSSWPRRVMVEEVAVDRLEHPPSNQLRQSLFRRSVRDWLNRHADTFSWIWCEEAGLDSLAVCAHPLVTDRQTPVIVRYSPSELAASVPDSTVWQPTQAILDGCAAATTVVATSRLAQQQLLKLGLPSERIVVCSDWITSTIDRSTATIRAARQALAEINSDLAIRSQDRVAVVPGELTHQWRLDFLIQAIVPLLDKYPNLRLWLHGDSPTRDRLYETLRLHGHHRTVAMPGVFTCLETLLQAADLCLFPARGVGLSWLLPSCIVSGIPVIAANSPELSWHLGALASSFSFDHQSLDSLQAKIEHWLRHPDEHLATVRIAGNVLRRQSSNSIPRGGLAELFRVPAHLRIGANSSQPQGNHR